MAYVPQYQVNKLQYLRGAEHKKRCRSAESLQVREPACTFKYMCIYVHILIQLYSLICSSHIYTHVENILINGAMMQQHVLNHVNRLSFESKNKFWISFFNEPIADFGLTLLRM